MVNINLGQIDLGNLISLMGTIITVLFIHFNSSSRIDATNQRIDKCIEDNQNLHKEIMELIKKLN